MDDRGRGLEFLVGTHSVVVPAVLVDRVVETELSPPPPMAKPWLGGFGEVDGQVFATIDLAPDASRTSPAQATCVLLETGKSKLKWALRVLRTVGFVEVARCPRPKSLPADWPSWIAGARFANASVVGLLDVAGMTRDFEK